MEKMESIFKIFILICLSVLAWVSVFIWHNMFTSILFTAAIFVQLWLLEAEQNN